MKTVTFKQIGYGQWRATTEYLGKEISMHFTDSQMYDLIQSKARGYKTAVKTLRSKIIRANNK